MCLQACFKKRVELIAKPFLWNANEKAKAKSLKVINLLFKQFACFQEHFNMQKAHCVVTNLCSTQPITLKINVKAESRATATAVNMSFFLDERIAASSPMSLEDAEEQIQQTVYANLLNRINHDENIQNISHITFLTMNDGTDPIVVDQYANEIIVAQYVCSKNRYLFIYLFIFIVLKYLYLLVG